MWVWVLHLVYSTCLICNHLLLYFVIPLIFFSSSSFSFFLIVIQLSFLFQSFIFFPFLIVVVVVFSFFMFCTSELLSLFFLGFAFSPWNEQACDIDRFKQQLHKNSHQSFMYSIFIATTNTTTTNNNNNHSKKFFSFLFESIQNELVCLIFNYFRHSLVH